MKKIYYAALILGSLLFMIPFAGAKQQLAEFQLKGVEIAKGFDIGDTRYGTRFTGKVFEEGKDVGYWLIVLNFRDFDNIEVCEGTNDIVKLRITVVFTRGYYAGNKLVLYMKDRKQIPDVFWNYMAPICDPFQLTDDLDCICPENLDLIEDWNCNGLPDDYGPIAEIRNLSLKKIWGTLSCVKKASLSGWLCHNYPFIPRVAGILVLFGDT